MKREYFGMLFLILFVAIWFALDYFFGSEKLMNFIVIWVLCGFYAGQYSMRFPKWK
jgi:hypothetical protein